MVAEAAPDLPADQRPEGGAACSCSIAGYAWLSLREQIADLTGQDAVDAVAWATDALLADLERRAAAPVAARPADTISIRVEEGLNGHDRALFHSRPRPPRAWPGCSAGSSTGR